MKLYMRQDLNEYENKSILPSIEYVLRAINIDNILKYYHMPLEYDYVFETINDVWKFFEFITATVEGIDMREFIDFDVRIFRIIKFCIRHEIDCSEIINNYNIDGADFAEAQFEELINSEKEKCYEFDDFSFAFGLANNASVIIKMIRLFASENRNSTFLWCRINTVFIEQLEYILKYQFKILKNTIKGTFCIQECFNKTRYSFKITDEKIYGISIRYELGFNIINPIINLEDAQK